MVIISIQNYLFSYNCFNRKFHTHILQFDGAGSWKFDELNANNRLSLKKEKEDLLKKPYCEETETRLNELNKLLGEGDN